MSRSERLIQMARLIEQNPNASIKELAGSLNVSTSTIRRDQALVGEMIGRVSTASVNSLWNLYTNTTVDRTQVNYEFWSKFCRGKAKGFELGGLFARPIAEIVSSWTWGSGVTVKVEGNENAETAANEFLSDNQRMISDWDFDGLTLGDGYIVVNPDDSLTPVPPNQVEIETNILDFREVVAYRIINKLEKATVTDEYRLDGRKITIEKEGTKQTFEYDNLIGMFPVVHYANEREANEIYGHPVFEALLTLFAEYDDVLRKSLDGVKVMGHPIPVAEGLEDPDSALKLNATGEEVIHTADGQTVTRPVIDFGRLSVFFLGKGGSFKFAQPGAFTQDAGRLLEYLFLLMLQHCKIPEWLWGGAIASSKASVDSQMPAFELFIQSRRKKWEATLKQLIKVWLATKALTDPSVMVAEDANITIEWSPLTPDSADITLQWVKWLYSIGKITDETSVGAWGGVDDPAAEVAEADKQNEEREKKQQERMDGGIPPNDPGDEDESDLGKVA